MSEILPLNLLTSGSYLEAVTVKAATSASLFSLVNIYFNQMSYQDSATLRDSIKF